MSRRVLVTGAAGFVGHFLCEKLLSLGFNVRGTLLPSETSSALVDQVEPVTIEPLGAETPLHHIFAGVDTIIHLAARVHIMRDSAADPLQEFRKVNLYGTEHLARQAAQAGVRCFVFMSTIGVNGDNSGDKSYSDSDKPNPHNPYSVSKYEAECALMKISTETGMEVVIIRAPLVYGPGNPGNFLTLLRILSKGIPLPLSSVQNSRSLIFVGNLVDALSVCVQHPAAAGQIYLVSDSETVSTPELIRRTTNALGVPTRLLLFPPSIIKLAGKLTGKSGAVNRLIGSLAVDSSKMRTELDWIPPFTMEEGLQLTAEWFNRQ